MTFTNTTLNVPLNKISLVDLSNNERAKQQVKDAAAEASKAYTLRGGSAGCITQAGNFLGANPWEVLGRFMGYQIPKTKVTYDIFDYGYANEFIWEKNLKHVTDYEITGDIHHPLTVPNFVGNYALTGRPDVILKQDGKAIMGAELKVVAGSSSAEKVLLGTPKTENLIQAGTYAAGFGLPWVLVYSSYSNFKGYKAALPPGKAEYHIGFEDGTLFFSHKGVITETIIDVQGIKEYYEAIVAAYEAKDHSWFRRSPENFLGEPEYFDADKYNTFNMMVDKNASWSHWTKEAEMAQKSPVIIDYSTFRKQDVYRVIDHKTMKVLYETNKLEDARTEMRSHW